MNYQAFQTTCAHYGFISTPISESQYLKAIDAGLDDNDCYELACDIDADCFDCFDDALSFYLERV